MSSSIKLSHSSLSSGWLVSFTICGWSGNTDTSFAVQERCEKPVLWSSLIKWLLLQNRLGFVDRSPSLCREKKGRSDRLKAAKTLPAFHMLGTFSTMLCWLWWPPGSVMAKCWQGLSLLPLAMSDTPWLPLSVTLYKYLMRHALQIDGTALH